MNKQMWRISLAAAAVVTTACSDDAPTSPLPTATGERNVIERAQIREVYRPSWTLDAGFERIASSIPEFAGLFFNEAGELEVRMTAVSASAATLRNTISAELGANFLRTGTREATEASIRLSGADYSILQLLDQYDSVLARLQQLEGIVWIDLDEVRNRIAIGVRPGAEGSLTAALRGRGADLDMFYFEVVTELPVPLHTLQSQFDTLMGGIQVTASGVCTLGVTVERSGSIEGFLTASHCVGTVFSMDSVAVGQPSSSDTVGTESIDPDVFACGDPDGCRYSDAVLVDVASGVDINLGLIAATTDRDSIRQLNVDHNNPVEIAFEVTSTPAVGTDIDKIGRSSGWSYGEIDQSCVNFVHQSSVTLICQYRTDAWAEGGDSGSPVFIGPISSDVQLAGILHSGDQDGDYLFWYSPIEGVHDDLGSFQVAAGPS